MVYRRDKPPRLASDAMAVPTTPLVVIGASSRAFALSAARAGWRVHAADLFGDLDLRTGATAWACIRDLDGGYPAGLVAACRRFPAGPFCYVGALENHPRVIRAIARDRPLWGSPPAAVAIVRDPDGLRRMARAAGLECPDRHQSPRGLPTDGSFLCKPLAGAGGRGIVPWHGGSAPRAGCIWQLRIAGCPWSAAFIVGADGGRLIGASRPLTGLDWCHARPFAYCGSIDEPLDALRPALRRQFAALAQPLAASGLRGLVGVDFVVDAEGAAWVLEVNPRPTASMELVERAGRLSLAATHIAACGGPDIMPVRLPDTAPAARWAKAVLYAPRSLRCDAAWHARLAALGERWASASAGPAVADIPSPGITIPAGGPVCTLFATGDTADAAVAALRERSTALGLLSRQGGAGRRPAVHPGRTP